MKRPSRRTVLIALGLFFLFLILRFPYRTLRGYIFGEVYRNTQIRMEADDLSPAFFGWPGVHLHGASLSLPMGPGSHLDVYAERITARVGIGGIFPPGPLVSVYLRGLQKGGNLYVKGARSGHLVRGVVESKALNLSQFLENFFPEPIEGLLNSTGHFGYDSADLSNSSGQFEMNLDKLHIPGLNLQGILLPSVSWDEVRAKLVVRNGSLEIERGQFGTPKSALRGELSGAIRLGRDWLGSRVNLVLRLQMTDAYRNDPQSATLVSFLKSYESTRNPGQYGLKWAASIQDMSTNIMAALPTPAE